MRQFIFKQMNSSSISEWLSNQNNLNTVNMVQTAVSLFFGILIFLKQYDFQSMLKSVRDAREAKRKEKERKKLIKFKKLMELAKNGEIDIDKIALSNDDEEDQESEEVKSEKVMKMARKKNRKVEMSV